MNGPVTYGSKARIVFRTSIPFRPLGRPICASNCVGDSSSGIGIVELFRCVFIEVAILFSTQNVHSLRHALPRVHSVNTSEGIGKNLSAETLRKSLRRARVNSGQSFDGLRAGVSLWFVVTEAGDERTRSDSNELG